MGSSGLLTWYAGAIALGALFGYSIGTLFGLVVKPGSTAIFWTSLNTNLKGLLVGEDEDFWPHYKQLMLSTFKYVGQQLAGVFVAFAPIIIALLFLGPWIMEIWERDADWGVFPAEAGTLNTPGSLSPETGTGRILTLPSNSQVELPREPGSVAVCVPESLGCLVLAGFGFHTLDVEDAATQEYGPIVVRATRNDWNPFWPYLSDPEFLFFLSLSLASVLFIFAGGKQKPETKASHQIGLMDNLMTQFAAHNSGMLKKVGDFETGLMESKLAGKLIDRPVFIAGLARSGTTILLEKLATLPGVGTHRYRDFPFIMAPVFWNRYLRIAGGRQQSAERPHQDGIEITRDSPDAFEEPIWQHFFSGLHDPERNHVFDATITNAGFEKFYREHLQKILHIRKGDRYLSKGNYNLPRIEYISSIFPDALFLIPIRHPLTHIESLVRQQQLFLKIAEDDPNSPDYLRAVGHYEFGVQRQPINMSADCAQRSLSAWKEGKEALGYAIQWAEIYHHVARLVAGSADLAKRIQVVRFEDLCGQPEEQFGRLLSFTGLGKPDRAAELSQGIKPSRHKHSFDTQAHQECWEVVREVAASYGYRQDPNELDNFNVASGTNQKS